MIAFTTRKLERTKTLGERLRKVREEAHLTLEDVEAGTQIRRKYLEAIESGQYASLPGPVYIENFLRTYARFLNVSEEFVLDVFRHQERKILKKEYSSTPPRQERTMPRQVITPKLVRMIIIGVLILTCLAYVGLEVAKIFSPPELIITVPVDSLTVDQETIEVSGSTEPEVTVTINGQQVLLGEDGDFSETITLKEGVNLITVAAAKKRSKTTVVQRRILFEKSTQ